MKSKPMGDFRKAVCTFLLLSMTFLYSCQSKMETTGAPVSIILDTDMGSDCDDVGALALLHEYANRGKVQILGCIYSSGKIPYGAGIIDAVNVSYKRLTIPVGATRTDHIGDPVDKMLAEKLAMDTGRYHNRIVFNDEAVEQTRLSRQLLSEQKDRSVTYVTIGHTHGLYELLISDPDDLSPLRGAELVERKIVRWIALGALNANNPEGQYGKDWNFFKNGTAKYTKYLVENFPRPIYYINGGSNVFTGRSLRAVGEGNIVRDAYESWLWNYQQRTLEDQRPSWDLVAVYFAVEGTGRYLKNEGRGYLDFNVEKGCRWLGGNRYPQQYFIQQIPGTDEEFGQYLNQQLLKSFDQSE